MATEPAKKESYAEYLKSLAELGIAVPEDNMFGTLGVKFDKNAIRFPEHQALVNEEKQFKATLYDLVDDYSGSMKLHMNSKYLPEFFMYGYVPWPMKYGKLHKVDGRIASKTNFEVCLLRIECRAGGIYAKLRFTAKETKAFLLEGDVRIVSEAKKTAEEESGDQDEYEEAIPGVSSKE